MKIALVHDWLNGLSGAERVLIELHNMFPEAPVYTLFHNKKFTSQYFPKTEIRSSFLQKIPGINRYYKYLFFLMPVAIESFDLSSFDVVISSSAIFSKGLVLKPKTRHICYCYSPTRQIWDLNSNSHETAHPILYALSRHFLRIWDRQAADRVTEFVAISEHVKQRIDKYYRKDAKVIYPPVSIESRIMNNESWKNHNSKFIIHNSGAYYLIVSRLFPHKNVDIAIEAFNKLNLPLLVIGDGPEYKNYKSQITNPKIELLGFVSDEELPAYYQNCKAFVMPQEEDFGITPIEAMLFGKPVLALGRGGALETVINGKTGEFFGDPIPEAIADGVRRLNDNYSSYDPEFIRKHAQKFSVNKFRDEISKLVYNN